MMAATEKLAKRRAGPATMTHRRIQSLLPFRLSPSWMAKRRCPITGVATQVRQFDANWMEVVSRQTVFCESPDEHVSATFAMRLNPDRPLYIWSANRHKGPVGLFPDRSHFAWSLRQAFRRPRQNTG